jgi:hypothetical protein
MGRTRFGRNQRGLTPLEIACNRTGRIVETVMNEHSMEVPAALPVARNSAQLTLQLRIQLNFLRKYF